MLSGDLLPPRSPVTTPAGPVPRIWMCLPTCEPVAELPDAAAPGRETSPRTLPPFDGVSALPGLWSLSYTSWEESLERKRKSQNSSHLCAITYEDLCMQKKKKPLIPTNYL